MKNSDKILREILEALDELGSPEKIEKSKTYSPTRMRVAGVTGPGIRLVQRDIKNRYRNLTGREWITLCKAMVESEVFECQLLAFDMIGKSRKLLGELDEEDLADLYKNLDNWASVDTFSVGIYGVLWRMGVVSDAHIDRLLQSENHWDRRVAVVSTVALNLKSVGGTGNTQRTLSVCERVVDDRHDMIQKALSWALRELSKRDRASVIEFMERFSHRLARRVIREVNHKLDFGTKN